ncbi:hypothetical protein MJO29_004239 [Puccinia striiformis f. sp. tritici]|nr:hypothetical protein MJO29_004239 [Puccinia striiformis f. sp. tritici]
MDYNNLNLDSGNPLGKALSIELEKEAIKELRDNLKEYLEACLIVVEFDEGGEAKSSKENSKKSVKVEDPATTEQLEEKIVKVTTALDYQTQSAPPAHERTIIPRFTRYKTKISAIYMFLL